MEATSTSSLNFDPAACALAMKASVWAFQS
jgi:hypothetical protein